jgi:hypothetical protein
MSGANQARAKREPQSRETSSDRAQPSQILDSVRIFYALFSEDLGWADSSESERIQQTAGLENAIKQLITAQESRFWVSVCDVLEYELTPVLEAWLSTVEKTRARVH